MTVIEIILIVTLVLWLFGMSSTILSVEQRVNELYSLFRDLNRILSVIQREVQRGKGTKD